MKTIFTLGLCIAVVFYAEAVFPESDEICCTWVNTSYTAGAPPQKLIHNFDGTFASYTTKESTDAPKLGTFRIVKKWKDSEGNIWYQIEIQGAGVEKEHELAKISDDGNLLEYVFKQGEYPIEINPSDSNYRKYTRE